MIDETALALLRRELEIIKPANDGVAKVREGLFTLIEEIEELQAALREMLHDWDQGAFLTRVALAKARAALGEKP